MKHLGKLYNRKKMSEEVFNDNRPKHGFSLMMNL